MPSMMCLDASICKESHSEAESELSGLGNGTSVPKPCTVIVVDILGTNCNDFRNCENYHSISCSVKNAFTSD